MRLPDKTWEQTRSIPGMSGDPEFDREMLKLMRDTGVTLADALRRPDPNLVDDFDKPAREPPKAVPRKEAAPPKRVRR